MTNHTYVYTYLIIFYIMCIHTTHILRGEVNAKK